MLTLEEEKSKILLDTIPFLRPLYIKGILSMYKILSISWKESLIDLQNKFMNLKLKNTNNNTNTVTKSDTNLEQKDINDKMFYIFSFMNYFYQMINSGKLKKYNGLDFIYTKLNNFLTFSRRIISYKILDINYEEFNQTKIILKLIIHVKLFKIFCEYDTYQSSKEFIEDLILIFNNKEKKESNENDDKFSEIKMEEEKIIGQLINDIVLEKIKIENIFSFVKKIYSELYTKYQHFIEEDKFTFFSILYQNCLESKSYKENESSDDEEDKDKKGQKVISKGNKKKKKKKRNKKNKDLISEDKKN